MAWEDDWPTDGSMDPYPTDTSGNALPPLQDTGSNTQTFDDGSTITTDSNGNPIGSTDAPAGAVAKDSAGNWLDAAGNILKPLLPVLGSLASPWLNNLQSGGLLKKGYESVEGAIGAANALKTPDLMSLIPHLKLQVQQGLMTPAEAQAALQEASNMQNVRSDQASLLGARTALGQLGDIAANRGMTEADRAAFAQFMNQQNANTAQNRAAQLQQLQMQGNAGTGAELAARLAGVQGGANANAMAGAGMAQAAQARALQAMQAGLSGNTALNQQMFSQDAQKAQAQDLVNQFNAQARQATNLQNATMQQQANLANFNTANEIAARNTGIQNEQLKMPLTTQQQQFANQLEKTKQQTQTGIYGGKILGDMGTAQLEQSKAAGAAAAGAEQPAAKKGKTDYSSTGAAIGTAIMPGIGTVIGGIAGKLFSDEDLKTDKKALSDTEVDDMMARLTGYKYRYKGNGNQQQAGVMAQDAEKGMPNSVVDTPAGKMIQKPEMLSNVLAILANQHDRIKRMEGN